MLQIYFVFRVISSELANLRSKYGQLVEIPILALLGKAIVITSQVLVENKKNTVNW